MVGPCRCIFECREPRRAVLAPQLDGTLSLSYQPARYSEMPKRPQGPDPPAQTRGPGRRASFGNRSSRPYGTDLWAWWFSSFSVMIAMPGLPCQAYIPVNLDVAKETGPQAADCQFGRRDSPYPLVIGSQPHVKKASDPCSLTKTTSSIQQRCFSSPGQRRWAATTMPSCSAQF